MILYDTVTISRLQNSVKAWIQILAKMMEHVFTWVALKVALKGWKLPFWARIQNHFKLPKITSKRSRDAFKREAVLESQLCWQVLINSHHTATPKKWLDLYCSSASVFIYCKMCDYKILLASNALQPFCKKGIKEYAR